MAVASFFALLVLFHLLLLLHLSEAEEDSCPPSFDCGDHGQIIFPLCGLGTVYCNETLPRIQLGGKLFEVKSPSLQAYTITLHDPQLQRQIDSRSCDSFHNISLPYVPSISFTILHDLTLFKCAEVPEFNKQTNEYFSGYHNYKECSNYTLYYKYPPPRHLPTPSSLPPNCSAIQMPMSLPDPYRNADDLFELLAADFSLELNEPDACNECRHRGGRCLHENYIFRCLNTKGRKRNLAVGVGTGASAAGMVIAIVLFCFFRRKYSSSKSMIFWKTRNENHLKVEGFLKNCRYLAPNRYSYSDIKKMTNSFKDKLGQGGYGCVYKGKLQNGCPVAVKVLNKLKGNGEDFINEVASISRTSHINIVTLLGFCSEGPKRALIYEFMPKGSLEKFIYEENSLRERQLGWETLYQIAVGTARGLEYLHRGCNARILHMDIKPHNILLDEDFCPKISDFGLAKLCPKKESIVSMSGMRGTIGYIAPEVFSRNFGGVSHKSDVYSYGMMVLEMVGGRKNINVEVDHTSEIYFPHWIYKRLELDDEIGLNGIMNDEENESVRKMIIVGLWCIQINPSNRPSMTKVVDMLEGSLESLQIPPRPTLSSPPRPLADSSAAEIL